VKTYQLQHTRHGVAAELNRCGGFYCLAAISYPAQVTAIFVLKNVIRWRSTIWQRQSTSLYGCVYIFCFPQAAYFAVNDFSAGK
jgi:hypothetical protein